MKKVKVYNTKGDVVKEVDLNSKIFDVQTNKGLIQQVVETQLANSRQVLAHTKNRGEVRGGGKKPWKQKGTGRARHGSSRSPIWVGGGVTFGPRNDSNFTKKINKNMKKKALFMTLSDKVKSDLLILLDEINIEQPKTKNIVSLLKKLPTCELKTKKIKIKDREKGVSVKQKDVKEVAKTLFVVAGDTKNTYLSTRNLLNVEVVKADSLNVVDVLKYKYLVMPLNSIQLIEKTYLNKKLIKK